MLLWRIFMLFTRVALFSWGGGPASLALMQRETTTASWLPPGQTVESPWVTPPEFADAVAFGNALPGPIAPQVSAFIGYKLAGWMGAVAAVAGTVLPTTLLMLFLVIYFFNVKDSPHVQSMLKAVRPVVVGLLLWTAYAMAQSVFNVRDLGWGQALLQNWDKLLITVATFFILTLTSVNPVIVIIAAAILGLLVYR
jgi:chromate transporter